MRERTMSQRNVTRNFPGTCPLGLEQERFRPLISDAVSEYLDHLLCIPPKLTRATVWRRNNDGIAATEIEFPMYGEWADPDMARATLSSPAINRLLDYVWERGERPLGLTGPDPKRDSWELWVVHDLLHAPLSRTLEQAAYREGVESGKVTLQRLKPSVLDSLVDELISRFCYDQIRYVAKCPLKWVIGEQGTVWQLCEGISLKIYSGEEELLYRSIYDRRLSNEDHTFLAFSNVAFIEIVGTVREKELRSGFQGRLAGEVIQERLEDTIDAVKLGLALAFGRGTPLIEGTVLCDDLLGGLLGGGLNKFRRQDSTSGIQYELNKDKKEQARQVIADLLEIRSRSEDIKQAIWYWGRSSVANLSRDVLLEAVIGLERLLVSGPGDSRYRFALHGTALLAASRGEAGSYAKDLKSLYDRRSSAAHGGGSHGFERDSASIAREYLAKAIGRIVLLSQQGLFNPSVSIAKQIEAHVLAGSPIRTHS